MTVTGDNDIDFFSFSIIVTEEVSSALIKFTNINIC